MMTADEWYSPYSSVAFVRVMFTVFPSVSSATASSHLSIVNSNVFLCPFVLSTTIMQVVCAFFIASLRLVLVEMILYYCGDLQNSCFSTNTVLVV